MSTIQVLLDAEAAISNAKCKDAQIIDARLKILAEIKILRGTETPPCHGDDDCSSYCLSVCPWRIDCGPQ